MSTRPTLDRRQLLAGLTATVTLAACGGDKGGDTADGDDTGDAGSTDGTGGATGTVDGAWATGGTAALAADYAVDFDDECAQNCELTLGPCYAETLERQDISEGENGLPTRIAFRVVDTDCNPVAGAVVDIWHCSPDGLYSGEDAADMCTECDADALAGRWFRGTQTAAADGVVTFDSCMPGWYPSRAVHIHFQVRVDGDAFVTSQLGFDETLLRDVLDNHPVYSPHGQPDTRNSADNILRGDAANLFSWRQADDGALVVWKTLTIRGSLSEPEC